MNAAVTALYAGWILCLLVALALDRTAERSGIPPAPTQRRERVRSIAWILVWCLGGVAMIASAVQSIADGEFSFRRYGYLRGLAIRRADDPVWFWSAVMFMLLFGLGAVAAGLSEAADMRRQRESGH